MDMAFKRFSKFLLVVLALALWAGTANAQPLVGTPALSLTYVSGGASVATTTSTTTAGAGGATGDAFTVAVSNYTGGTPTGWLLAAETASSGMGTDTVTYTLVTTNAATWPAGTYHATVTITDASDTSGTTTGTATATLVVTSPLSATTASTTMTAVIGQASVTYVDTVTNSDASFDLYTVSASAVVSTTSGCPAYLTWANTHTPTFEAKSGGGGSDVLTFTLNPTAQTAVVVTGCVVTLKYNGVSIAAITFTSLTIVGQPLMISANPSPGLGYSKGTSAVTGTGISTVKIATNTGLSVPFILDVATVAPWLTLQSGLSGSPLGANTGTGLGNPVVFTVNTAVAAGMATGNYTAQVGFFQTGSADLLVPFTLQISNAAPSVTVTPSSAQAISYSSSMPVPQPTADLYSTDEPVPFTATCSATTTAPYLTKTTGFTVGCLMNGTVASGATAVVNGTAFTWGFPMTVTLDPLLFASTVPIGNTVTVTITFSGLGAITAPTAVSYVYTLQPGVIVSPLTVGPTSVAAGFKTSGSSFVVLLTGNNFVGPGSLASTSTVVDTQVWLGTPAVLLTNANAATLGSYVVLNASQMQVTIVGSALPTFVAGHAAAIAIGVANQTGAAAPTVATATTSLNVTNSPVNYGMTSTASFNQPAVGVSPSFAPYDLISIFGDNFGLTGLIGSPTSANASYDTYGKVVSPLALGTVGTPAKPVTLAVKFVDVATGHTSFTSPVLFANENQINALVPAGVVGDQYVTITAGVTGATATSDNFLVHVVPADPGIFTLTSDGTGGGAIVNQSGTVNGTGKPALVSTIITFYLAGLGAPDSIGLDLATANVTNYPATCVAAIGGSAAAPSLLTVVNTKVGTTYTSPAWTNLDGAVLNYGVHDILAGNAGDLNYPPCMATAAITVTFGTPLVNSITVTGTAGVGGITYAGFVSGSVAGLYQINVQLPASLTGIGTTPATFIGAGGTPVSITIAPSAGGTYTTQTGVTIVF